MALRGVRISTNIKYIDTFALRSSSRSNTESIL